MAKKLEMVVATAGPHCCCVEGGSLFPWLALHECLQGQTVLRFPL